MYQKEFSPPPLPPTLAGGDLGVFGPPGPFSPRNAVAGIFPSPFGPFLGRKKFFQKKFLLKNTSQMVFRPQNHEIGPLDPPFGPIWAPEGPKMAQK